MIQSHIAFIDSTSTASTRPEVGYLHHESWSAIHQEDKDEAEDKEEEEDQDDREDREDGEEENEEEDKLALVCVEGFYCFIRDNVIEIC